MLADFAFFSLVVEDSLPPQQRKATIVKPTVRVEPMVSSALPKQELNDLIDPNVIIKDSL